MTFSSVESLNKVLDGMELPMLEIPKPALFLADKAFLQYRSGSVKNSVLGEFFYWSTCCHQRLPCFNA
jgi:hypothetical protein